MLTPVNPSFTYKSGVRVGGGGVKIIQVCFRDGMQEWNPR